MLFCVYRLTGIFFLTVLMGCGTTQVKVFKTPENGSYPLKTAVLPFTVDAQIAPEKRPDTILREVFFNYFSYLGYTDMPPGEVDRRLKSSGYDKPGNVSSLSLAKLREILGVDAVIKGHILDANNFTGGFYAETRIHARLVMIDLLSGELLWEAENHEIDHSSLATPTIVDIVQQQLENANMREAYYKVAQEFSVKVLREIPDPANAPGFEVKLPEIARVQVNLPPKPKLKAGDTIQVNLFGQEGLAASFDIGNWRTFIPLTETRPGFYTGIYRVADADRVADALVIVRLADKSGLTNKRVHQGLTISIDNHARPSEGAQEAAIHAAS